MNDEYRMKTSTWILLVPPHKKCILPLNLWEYWISHLNPVFPCVSDKRLSVVITPEETTKQMKSWKTRLSSIYLISWLIHVPLILHDRNFFFVDFISCMYKFKFLRIGGCGWLVDLQCILFLWSVRTLTLFVCHLTSACFGCVSTDRMGIWTISTRCWVRGCKAILYLFANF